MLGALVLFVITWLLLVWLGQGLQEVGFNQSRRRVIESLAGLFLAASFAGMKYLATAHFAGFAWQLNPSYDIAALLEGLRFNIASVLFEEFIFRGVLLWLAIRWLGTWPAVLLSAAAFGIYHWFSFGVLGDFVTMAFVFILTGSFGMMLAYAFAWSRSISLPIALHLGWNFMNNEVFSGGPQGERMLLAAGGEAQMLGGMEQLLVSLVIPLSLPLLVILLLAWPLSRLRVNAKA